MKVKIRNLIGADYPTEIIVTLDEKEFLRIVADEMTPDPDERWFAQPSGAPVDDQAQKDLDFLVTVETVHVDDR